MMPNPKLLSRPKAMALTREMMAGALPVVGGGLDGARPAVLVDAGSRPDVAEMVQRWRAAGQAVRVKTMLAAQATDRGTLLVVLVALDDGEQSVRFKVTMCAEHNRGALDAVELSGQLIILLSWPGDESGVHSVVEAGVDKGYLRQIMAIVGPDVQSVRAQN